MTTTEVLESRTEFWERMRRDDPYRGLGRLAPHIMPMLGQFVCFRLDLRGRIICAGSGISPVAAYCSMNYIQ
jgi:hypothetical protein